MDRFWVYVQIVYEILFLVPQAQNVTTVWRLKVMHDR